MSYQTMGLPPPKMATFHGKSEWNPYLVQFNMIASRYNRNNEQRLERLVESLRDKALKYYCTCSAQVQISFSSLCAKNKSRFGQRVLPHTIRRNLQDIKQGEHTADEFAEKIQEVVCEGYPQAPDCVKETIATDAFLIGLENKRAAFTTMDKNPPDLETALQLVKAAHNNQRLILGTKIPEVRKVHFEEDDR